MRSLGCELVPSRTKVATQTVVITAVFFALLALVIRPAALAQKPENDVVSLLRRHQYGFTLTHGRLEGAGAAWLREQAATVQFLFVGEEHDTSEIPTILAALWPDLVNVGYRHVAIEAGQWLGNRLDRSTRFDDREALSQFQRATWPRRPSVSVPPSSAEDVAFYAALGKSMKGRERSDSALIWGLDHEFKATPLMNRLAEISPHATLRPQIQAVAREIADAERAHTYNMQPFKRPISGILDAVSTAQPTETSHLVDALRRRVSGETNDQPRGDVFRQLFVRNYRAAQAAGAPNPRVLLRFGGYHAKRGLMSEFGTSTFANFVAEFATLEGAQMLNVVFVACSVSATDDWRAPRTYPRPCSPREREWLKPFIGTSAGAWTLYDLRPLRRLLGDGTLKTDWELWEVIMGFDAVILLEGSQRARLPA